MDTFESSIKEIKYSQETVFSKISDLNNLKSVEDKLPKDKIKSMTYDSDSVTITVDSVGSLSLRIIERQPYKTIKFVADQAPILFNMWIQLLSTGEESCKMKVTIKAELNMLTRNFLKKPLQDGVEKIATMISMIKF